MFERLPYITCWKKQTSRKLEKTNTSAADTTKMSAWHCASGLESAAFASAHSWSTYQLITAGILKQRKQGKFHRKSSNHPRWMGPTLARSNPATEHMA